MISRVIVLIVLLSSLLVSGCGLHPLKPLEFSPIGYPSDYRSDILVTENSKFEPAKIQKKQFDLKKEKHLIIGNFDYDKSELTPKMMMEIKAGIIETRQEIAFIIATADRDGSYAYNKKLSRARAKSTKDFLVKNNFAIAGVKFMGAGETEVFGVQKELNRCLIFIFK